MCVSCFQTSPDGNVATSTLTFSPQVDDSGKSLIVCLLFPDYDSGKSLNLCFLFPDSSRWE